jgi:spore coat polysaccharide biosynthesis protein SpsF
MNQKPLIAVIVQARMGSTRLPGKVLKKILGEPMLWHLVNRVKKSRYVDTLIIAATEDKKDDAIEIFANEYHLGIYRGSEKDIVDRYYNAARKYNADIVVRIWGDCPLIDPEIIDKTIEQFLSYKAEYANNSNPPTFPFGMTIEIYSFNTLERIWKETRDPFFREYPFEYIYANKESFKTVYVKNDVDLSDIHLTVDYIEDFELITKIFEDLYSEHMVFNMKDILELIDKHPGLRVMNKEMKRNIEYTKELKERQKLIEKNEHFDNNKKEE